MDGLFKLVSILVNDIVDLTLHLLDAPCKEIRVHVDLHVLNMDLGVFLEFVDDIVVSGDHVKFKFEGNVGDVNS